MNMLWWVPVAKAMSQKWQEPVLLLNEHDPSLYAENTCLPYACLLSMATAWEKAHAIAVITS